MGGTEAIELPDDHDDPNASSLIETAAHTICLELARRKEMKRVSEAPQQDIAAWLRPICYRFIMQCIDTALLEVLYKRQTRYRRFTNTEEVFSRGLAAIFAEDSLNFTHQDQHRYSRQLWYAYRHYVPWVFLNGFLSQLQNFEKQKALSRIEPGFEDWIVSRKMAEYSPPDPRGSYSKEIETRSREGASDIMGLIVSIGKMSRLEDEDEDEDEDEG